MGLQYLSYVKSFRHFVILLINARDSDRLYI